MGPLLKAEDWINKYGDILYNYTLQRVSDKGLAEDIVQDTFLSAWKSRETYNAQASEKNWLFAICKNKIIDHYRKKSTSKVQYGEADTTSHFFDDAEHWTKEDQPNEWGINYQQPVETKEFYNILELCKKKLQEMQKNVFVMKYMEDLESDEICKVLNITPSNYWVIIHRAKLQLRKCIEKNWLNN
ncbi:sigma-70 family RNA polymerase sigma factor [Parasediminibacterium sp. JCM 36343]|uniref:sigma-70 family RNA polymerase sigma factor n=1 Tax=Parasediminibacterium sp. JCM 36343 TaxID=3374279 RepID=UPI00397A0157